MQLKNNKHLLFHTVTESQESESALAEQFWHWKTKEYPCIGERWDTFTGRQNELVCQFT